MGGGLGYMLLGAGVAAWWLSKEENRSKFDRFLNTTKNKISKEPVPSPENFPVLKAGNPDPEDIADNKMVEEGSQFGVHYYDEKRTKLE
nr:hypothetical protein [Bacillus xiapuensis]